jgi:hypothetical protein
MKTLFVSAIALFLSFQAFSQEEYCEAVFAQKGLFSSKVNMTIETVKGTELVKGPDGKPKEFLNNMEGLTHLAKDGWVFLSAYAVSVPQGGALYRYLMKRPVKQ